MLFKPEDSIWSTSTEWLHEIQEEHKLRELVEPLTSFWDTARQDWRRPMLAGIQSDTRHEEVKLLPALAPIPTICLNLFQHGMCSTVQTDVVPCGRVGLNDTDDEWLQKQGGARGSECCCCCCQGQLSWRRGVEGKVHLMRGNQVKSRSIWITACLNPQAREKPLSSFALFSR